MNKTTYTITSQRFTGNVVAVFVDGFCSVYNDLESNVNLKQRHWFLSRLNKPEEEFITELSNTGFFNIVGAKEEITFEMFWNKYDEKDRSSRKKAQIKWNRMSKEQQILAYAYIPTYFKNIPNGIAKKYAETYLNSEIWNN